MSKWDKLLAKIKTLSNDIRFEELKKILEVYGYKMYSPKGGSAILPFVNKDVQVLRFQNKNLLKKYMSN